MSKKPSEQAKSEFEGVLWIGHTYGVCYFDGVIFHPRLIFIIFAGIFEQFMHFNGLVKGWPDIANICSSLSILCLILQILSRLLNRIVRPEDENIMAMLKTLITFYEHEEQNHNHRAVINSHLKVLHALINGYLLVNFVIFSIPNPTAWIVSWISGEFILFAPIYIPGTDPTTLIGYIINSTLLVFYTILVFVIFMTADIFFIYFLYQTIPMVDIYCIKMKEFGKKLEKIKTKTNPFTHPTRLSIKSPVKIKNVKQLEAQEAEEIEDVDFGLIKLIKEFENYNEYVRTIVEYAQYTTLTALSLNSMAIGMAFIVLFQYSKGIGGAIVFILFLQVFIPCIFGTLLAMQKEKLLKELFGFPWYMLSLSKQKIFLQFIHLIQQSNEFTVPYIGNLDMELFTNIMNAAYSYVMYLLKFVEIK